LERVEFWPERRKQMVREWIGVFEGRFYLWDLLPAVYLSYPEIFSPSKATIVSSIADLEKGILLRGEGGIEIEMPDRILDVSKFMDILVSAWQNAWEKERRGWD
jgi:hypothetical protein